MQANQIVMVSLDSLVSQDHEYRKFLKLFDFTFAEKTLKTLEKSAYYTISTK